MFLRNTAIHLLENHKPAKDRKNTCKNKKTVWDSLKEILKICDFLKGTFLLKNKFSLEIPPNYLLENRKPAKHRNNTCKNKKTVWDSLKEILKICVFFNGTFLIEN